MEKIVLIGAGNVGYHLGKRLFEKGLRPIQVFSRTPSKAIQLAESIEADPCSCLVDIRRDGTLYILAVSDDAIEPLSEKLSLHLPANALIVHTSGATPSTVLANSFSHYGVFYPLQTFSVNRPVNFDQIPICIDAPHKRDFEKLWGLGHVISSSVHRITDEQRAVLHVAAVFVNNFTNYLFGIGYDILKNHQLPFALLQPLITETVAKIKTAAPQEMQTGPAARRDKETINRHLKLLHEFPTFQTIYRQMSQGIETLKK